MDTLRGNFEALDEGPGYEAGDDDNVRDTPPAAIGQDERRMQVRAYNHWASLLDDRNFPSIDDLDPDSLPDFGPYSVLLDFTSGIENPGVTYLGKELAIECDMAGAELKTLADVPTRSLLSRITDHYMQIIANQAPIGFEAEFVNQRDATILYRGILLPYSTDDEKIDFIFGVINWKQLADQHTSDELLLQVDQALEQKPQATLRRVEDAPMTDWADGPGAAPANDLGDEPVGAVEPELESVGDEGTDDLETGEFIHAEYEESAEEDDFDYAKKFNLGYGEDEEFDEDAGEGEDEDDGAMPRPSFGSLTSIGGGLRKSEPRPSVLPEIPSDEVSFPEIDLEDVNAHFGEQAESPDAPAYGLDHVSSSGDVPEASDDFDAIEDFGDDEIFDLSEAYSVSVSPVPEPVYLEPATAELDPIEEAALLALDPDEMELGDWLAAAREMAAAARTSEDRTRSALYEAIGRAYDFSLAATEKPEDFEELLVDSGLTMQDRAPMTPVVKLVFGGDYDKTRLTEYAAALSHAHRLSLPRNGLGEYLRQADGGLKGVVQAERRMRKAESGKEPGIDPREALVAKLRAMPAGDFAAIDPSGSEFALVMIRRGDAGEVVMIGEIPQDDALLERAARKLVG